MKDYPNINKRIAERENEILHPVYERDDNIGGGVAKNKQKDPTYKTIVTIEDDKEIQTLRRERKVIDDLLDNSGEDTETIIKECYMKKQPSNIKKLIVTGKIYCSQSTAFRLRDRFIEQVAKELNLNSY